MSKLHAFYLPWSDIYVKIDMIVIVIVYETVELYTKFNVRHDRLYQEMFWKKIIKGKSEIYGIVYQSSTDIYVKI